MSWHGPGLFILRSHLPCPRPGTMARVTADISPAPKELPVRWAMDMSVRVTVGGQCWEEGRLEGQRGPEAPRAPGGRSLGGLSGRGVSGQLRPG